MSTLVQRIEQKMKESGLTFKSLERECGLGNGTIKRWNEQSPRLDKLATVSERLHLSMDYLVFGRDVVPSDTPSCLGVSLSQRETDLIAMLRVLPCDDQEDFFDFIQLKYKKHVERKSESDSFSAETA